MKDLIRKCNSPGDLNYVISYLCDGYIGKSPTYKKLNETIGVLECAKLELYRQVLAPYENMKCEENGEVHERSTS
jgi:hypothetical protein